MSIYDPVGSTDVRIVKDLETRIAALETLVRTVTGAPVTKASGPLFVPNASTPATPSGGIRIYAVGGTFRVIQSDGTIKEISEFTPADNVIVPGISAPNAPGTYSQSQAQAISDGLATTYNSLVALIVNLRAAGILV
ncbi:hypothetical protein [Nonomuraea sp. NPDC049158]|uniref:hypothetical protein n=1 Tax=Nonomuraea sp. NPDC049158 TaxID=3155649 RepID=UPI0033FD1123